MSKRKVLSDEVIKYVKLEMFEDVIEVIDQDPNVIFRTDAEGDSLLIWACQEGSVNCAQMLMDYQSNIDLQGTFGDTPLIKCIKIGYPDHEKIFNFLMEKKADINLVNHEGETAFAIAAKFHRFEMAKKLVDRKCNINFKCKLGNTPLIRSCYYGDRVLFDYLLSINSDINIKNDNGESAIITACRFQHIDMVKKLIELGADINDSDCCKRNGLMHCFMISSEKLTDIFIELKGNLNAKDIFGYTALMYSVKDKNLMSSFKKLLALKVDCFALDRNGDNALIIACRYKNFEAARLLVKQGLKIDTINLDGKKAVDFIEDETEKDHFIESLKYI